MSPSMLGAIAEGGIPMLAGAYMLLTGYRVIGPKPGASEARDRWHAKFGRFFRVGGLFVLGVGIMMLVVAVAREWPPKPDGWSRHATADGACGIDFPQAPRHEVNPDGEEGNRLEVVIPERQTRYSLIFSDLSPKDAARPVDDVFRDLGAIYAKTPGGAPARLLKELAITDRGFPGREYQFAVGDRFVTRIKVFVNGARVYRAIAVNPPDAALDRDAQRFIDSFRFEVTKP